MVANDPLSMLSRLLDAARTAAQIDALAIADESGLLIAGAGAWNSCEELAALAPFLDRPRAANDVVPTRLDVLARRSEVRRITINGIRVFVCGEGANAEQAVTQAVESCELVFGKRTRSVPPLASTRGW